MASPLRWNACLGRNGWDHPMAIPDDMGAECLNVVFLDSGLAQRRPGAALVTTTGDSWNGIAALDKYVPPTGLASANVLLISLDDPPRMLTGTTALVFSTLTLTDAFQSRPQDATTCQLNNKQFVAYDSAVNRLHVWDPTNAPTLLTRTGLALPAAPTGGNTGVGTYAATLRWYRVQWRTKVGSSYLRQSELGATLAFTPSGTGTAARVTMPALAGETETHWALYASADSINGPFYQIAETVIGTTTFDDSVVPSSYNTGTLAPLEGAFTPFPSVKFLVSDGNRLLGLGAYETAAGDSVTPKPGRVYYTPVLGSTDRGDDERIEEEVLTEGWIDLTPGGAGAEDRGMGGPLNGEFYAFQSKGIYRLIPTGQAAAPFSRHQLTPHAGGLSHRSIILGEDEQGQQCIYFLNPTDGPRRIQLGGGMQWLGRDVFDLWQTVNQDAATVKAWGLYDDRNKRIIWWVATSSADTPTLMIVYDVTKGRSEGMIVRYGWAKWTGYMANWLTGVMFPQGASNVEVPYGGPTLGAGALARVPGGTSTVYYEYGTGSGSGGGGVPGGSYQSAVGTYLATGTALSVTCGFQPTCVIVWPLDADNIGVAGHIVATQAGGCLKTGEMAGLNSHNPITHNLITNGIVSLDTNGFTVGTGAEANFVTTVIPFNALRYQYLAIRDTSQTYFRTGTYVGNAITARQITVGAAGFQPNLVWIYGNSTGGVVRDSNMVGNFSIAVNGVINTLDYIQAFFANGFTVSDDTRVNQNGTTFYYLSWKDDVAGSLAANAMKMGHYTGNAGSQAVAVGWGLAPPLVESAGPTVEGAARRGTQHTGSNSTRIYDGAVRTTDITAMSTAGFTVGLGASAAATEYYWHAFRSGSILT